MFISRLFWRFPLFIMLAMFSITGCSRRSPNDLYVVKALKTGLEQSNQEIRRDSEMIFNSFKLKADFPETMGKVALLLPEMIRIRKVTSLIIQEIESAQADLKDEASSKDETEAFYYEDNLDAVESLFIKQKRATHLFRKIREYKLMLIDSAGNNTYVVNNFLRDIPLNVSGLKDLDNFIEFFKNQPAISADAFLEQLKANLLLNEKKLLLFVNDRVTNHLQHSFPEVVVSQNTNVLRQGDTLKIKAGIGSFQYYTQSSMIAEGIIVNPDEKGVFNYSATVKANSGKYQLPISLTFIEADGNPQRYTTTIEYEIIK